MTPGSVLILSGALIFVAVSAYDAVSGSSAPYGSRRRRSPVPLLSPPDPMFAARLARYGVSERADADTEIANTAPRITAADQEIGAAPYLPPTPASEDGPPTRRGPGAFVDVLADLDAFDRWLRAGRARFPEPQSRMQAGHHLTAAALFAFDDETARTRSASSAQDPDDRFAPRRVADLDRDASEDADPAIRLR